MSGGVHNIAPSSFSPNPSKHHCPSNPFEERKKERKKPSFRPLSPHGRNPQPLWYRPVHLCIRSEQRCPQYRTLLFFPTHWSIIVPSNPSEKESLLGTLQGHLPNRKAALQVPFDPLSMWWKPDPFGANVSICAKRVSRGVHNIALSFRLVFCERKHLTVDVKLEQCWWKGDMELLWTRCCGLITLRTLITKGRRSAYKV
jgi:hypothetical protein